MPILLLTKSECETRLRRDYQDLYLLLGMSWWHPDSPLRRWLTRADHGYHSALTIFTEQLRTIHRLFPTDYTRWMGLFAHPSKFWAKIFEVRCIHLLSTAGIQVSRLDPQYETDNRPDFEVVINGIPVTVECTSLRHEDLTQRAIEQAIEEYEVFSLRFREIPRPYHIMLNVLPDFSQEDVTDQFFSVFATWLENHDNGEEQVFSSIPGFKKLNRGLTPGLPAARVVYVPGSSHVSIGGKSVVPIIPGSPQGLRNALERKRQQVRGHQTGMNVIVVDMAFRTDRVLSQLTLSTITGSSPTAVEVLFARRNARHISGIHLSQMNIFSTAPIATANGWMNPNAAIQHPEIIKTIFHALEQKV